MEGGVAGAAFIGVERVERSRGNAGGGKPRQRENYCRPGRDENRYDRRRERGVRGRRSRDDVSWSTLFPPVDHGADEILARAAAFENSAGHVERDQSEQPVGEELVHGPGRLADR